MDKRIILICIGLVLDFIILAVCIKGFIDARREKDVDSERDS